MTRRDKRGNALFEFSILLACFMAPLFLGVYAVGFNLLQQLEVIQFCRDAGHLWSTSVANLTDLDPVLQTMGRGLNFPTATTVIFSKVVFVDTATCSKLGGTPPCANANKWAYQQYYVRGSGGFSSIITAPSVTSTSTNPTDVANGVFDPLQTCCNSGTAVGADLGSRIPIASYTLTDPDGGTALPSGQSIFLVQVASPGFSTPLWSGVLSVPALRDFAVF